SWRVIVGAGAGVAAFVLLVVVIASFLIRRRGMKTPRRRPRQCATEVAVIERRSLTEAEGSHQSAHFYMEVLDLPPPCDDRHAAEAEVRDQKTCAPFYENTQTGKKESPGPSQFVTEHDIVASSANQPSTSGISNIPKPDSEATDNDPESDRNNTEYVPYDPRLYENTKA
ncbi:hypothetical protein BaRGS_00024587, partial [Batillaria attramentaria]